MARADLLTPQSAIELFQQFRTHRLLTWDHSNTGCESRADLMAELAVGKGLEPGKIWIGISPGAEGVFGIYLNNARTEIAVCNYHVAVVLAVEGDPLVFDPAFFGAPVSRHTWSERLSSYCRERNYKHLVSDSDWRNFYGPVQAIYNRAKAVRDRTKLLELAHDLDDPMTLSGCLAMARGQWADVMQESDPGSFETLQAACRNEEFSMWFQLAQSGGSLKDWLQANSHYFGLPSADILGAIDFSDRLAAVEVRKKYWRYVRDLFSLLARRHEELSNHSATGKSAESKLAFRFMIFCGNNAKRQAEAKAEWYGAGSHELWQEYGVDYRALQKYGK